MVVNAYYCPADLTVYVSINKQYYLLARSFSSSSIKSSTQLLVLKKKRKKKKSKEHNLILCHYVEWFWHCCQDSNISIIHLHSSFWVIPLIYLHQHCFIRLAVLAGLILQGNIVLTPIPSCWPDKARQIQKACPCSLPLLSRPSVEAVLSHLRISRHSNFHEKLVHFAHQHSRSQQQTSDAQQVASIAFLVLTSRLRFPHKWLADHLETVSLCT